MCDPESINALSRDDLEALLVEKSMESKLLQSQLEQELQERTKLECQLVQVQKMESLGQLAAGVAHEINNPISFVTSNLLSLKDYIDFFLKITNCALKMSHVGIDEHAALITELQSIIADEDVNFILEDVTALLSESEEGLRRVKEIVQNLKSFARLDEAELKEADINECLDATIKLVWNELKYKCDVIRHYDVLPVVPCYPGQLNQVFMNLLVNASHAIVEKGTITISTKAYPDIIEIRISDTGVGIPEELIPKLFDPFFTTKPVGSGTGLGLSISYGVIQKHHGAISVESQVGVGTTFIIQLPTNFGGAPHAQNDSVS